MPKIRLAIVGCGGMGHRHMYGLAELHQSGWDHFDLVGVCDPVKANAESLASQVTEQLGISPTIVNNLDDLATLGVEAVDVTTTPRYHHTIAIETLERGWHTMVEKPMGLTVRACNLIRRASEASDAILSVAENYRRDPINRLAKALLDASVIGDPRLLIHHTIGGSDQMMISVWRHQKNESGILLDDGVHFTDIMEYLLGDIETVYAQTRLHEKTRKNPTAGSSNPTGVYGKWQKQMPAEFEATAEDAAYATLTFKNGAVGQYIEDHAGHGRGMWARQIYGSSGSMTLPSDRGGGNIILHLEGQEVIEDQKILDLVPDFQLDDITTRLFGGNRLWRYQFPFPETDRKIIAIEYADFAEAISGQHQVEVNAAQGTRSVAASYSMMESHQIGRLVTVEEVITEQVDSYQEEINDSLGLEPTRIEGKSVR